MPCGRVWTSARSQANRELARSTLFSGFTKVPDRLKTPLSNMWSLRSRLFTSIGLLFANKGLSTVTYEKPIQFIQRNVDSREFICKWKTGFMRLRKWLIYLKDVFEWDTREYFEGFSGRCGEKKKNHFGWFDSLRSLLPLSRPDVFHWRVKLFRVIPGKLNRLAFN